MVASALCATAISIQPSTYCVDAEPSTVPVVPDSVRLSCNTLPALAPFTHIVATYVPADVVRTNGDEPVSVAFAVPVVLLFVNAAANWASSASLAFYAPIAIARA